METFSTVIVGAGLAGIAAALELPGAVLFDPDGAGGKAKTLSPAPGWTIEWGPHSLSARSSSVLSVAERLGVAAIPVGEAPRYLARDGRLNEAGLGALKWSERAGLLAGMVKKRPVRPDETVGEVSTRFFGAAFTDGPLDAMLGGVYAAAPAEIALDAAFPHVYATLQTHAPGAGMKAMAGGPKGVLTLAGGLGAVGAAAEQQLHVARRAVRGITRDGERFVLATDDGDMVAERVIVATNASGAARLLGEVAPAAATLLAGIRHSPLLVAHWLSGDVAYPKAFGWLAPFSERLGALGTIHVSDVLPGRCPPDRRAFATMLGGSRAPEALSLSETEVAARLVDVHRRLTGKDLSIDALHVVVHPEAVAMPGPGHLARIAAIRAQLPAGLAVAGAWCGAAALPDAVVSGQVAARVLLGGPRVG